MAKGKAFDPYREGLVVETETIWPEDLADVAVGERARVAPLLHADPENAANLEYVRMHTGFCRQITVTPEDIQRIG